MTSPRMTLRRFNLLTDALLMMERTIEAEWDDEAEAEKALAELDAVWRIVQKKWGHLETPTQVVTQ
jgi:hypothetical protein